jgi:ankyrin repeat protein
VAASKGHAETVSVLKNKGADTSRKDFKGGHALLEACLSGHEPTVNLLLERGAK